MRYLALLVASLCLGSATAEAQELRRPTPTAFDDSAKDAALQTRADTVALVEILLPVALDSLASDTSAYGLWSHVHRYPQLLLSDELGSVVDTAWLTELVAARRVRGVCAPIVRSCRRTDAIRVSLADQPGEGDNAVFLVLALTGALKSGSRPVDIEDDNERQLRLWDMGIFQPAPLWWVDHVLHVIPRARLRAERLETSWRIMAWDSPLY